MKKILIGVVVLSLAGTASVMACCFGPPELSVEVADVDCLWPPNHKMVDIPLNVTVSPFQFQTIPSPISWQIDGVVVIDNDGGDGNTEMDYAISPDGQSLQLRAERSGKGADAGREYIVTVSASNNWATETATVSVFVCHDKRK